MKSRCERSLNPSVSTVALALKHVTMTMRKAEAHGFQSAADIGLSHVIFLVLNADPTRKIT